MDQAMKNTDIYIQQESGKTIITDLEDLEKDKDDKRKRRKKEGYGADSDTDSDDE